jgi:hypothetical protein
MNRIKRPNIKSETKNERTAEESFLKIGSKGDNSRRDKKITRPPLETARLPSI